MDSGTGVATQRENSDVFPNGSVAVAVMTLPGIVGSYSDGKEIDTQAGVGKDGISANRISCAGRDDNAGATIETNFIGSFALGATNGVVGRSGEVDASLSIG